MEGMDGMDTLAGCRGTPGLEGYPGVVLKTLDYFDPGHTREVILTDLPEQYSKTACYPVERC